MNSVKGKINKLILGLTSFGMFFFLMFPASLYADHFRYGTMSWEPIDDNGKIRLKMQNGWSADHNFISAYTAGQYRLNALTINWGDGSNSGQTIDLKVLSRDNTANDTITEMGDNSSSLWTLGWEHQYSSPGTYVVSWGSSSRETTENM